MWNDERPRRRRARTLRHVLAGLLASLVAESARAGEPWEKWPEASVFIELGSTTRAYLDASYAKGKESPFQTIDASACLDISFKPLLGSLAGVEWRRGRYFWARVGYTRVAKVESGLRQGSENRGVLALHGKFPLPAGVFLEGRARVDLRWFTGGSFSTRYRARLEATREFTIMGLSVVPYLNAEGMYDTRFRGFSRALYQTGAEVAIERHIRLEPYLARQVDYLAEHSTLNAIGLVLKLYL